jgi:phthalate 4,5-dioxygenase
VIDSAHISFLHSSEIGAVKDAPSGLGDGNAYQKDGQSEVIVHAPTRDTRPRFEIEDTPYGFWYGAIRKPVLNPETMKYVRTTHFVAPFWGLFPPPRGTGNMQAFVPADDHHTYFFYFQYQFDEPVDREFMQRIAGTIPGLQLDEQFRIRHSRADNWGQNRDIMRTGRSYSGIEGINVQDFVMQESMGPIYDRTKEHLGVSDLAVIRMRRVMLDSVRRFMHGGAPVGLDQPVPYERLSGADDLIPIERPWQSVGAVEATV